MKTLKNRTVGIVTTLVLLLPVFAFVNAQTIGEVINETSNSMVLRLESKDKLDAPAKIMLVYDSNMITLESTSVMTRGMGVSSSRSYGSSYKMSSALAVALIEDIEDDIELEEWMLQPFEMEASRASLLKQDEEEEMELEPWMTDLNHWK